QRRSEPEHLLAMAPLAAVVRLAGPTTLVMAVSAVSNILYTHLVSPPGVDAVGAPSLVFPGSLPAIPARAGGLRAGPPPAGTLPPRSPGRRSRRASRSASASASPHRSASPSSSA